MVVQLRTIAWGRTPSGHIAELLQLARCDSVAENTFLGANEYMNDHRERTAYLKNTTDTVGPQLDRLKEEIELLRSRLSSVRKRIQKNTPSPISPYKISKSSANVDSLLLDPLSPYRKFLETGQDLFKSPKKSRFELNLHEWEDGDDDEDKLVQEWIDKVVEGAMYHGPEADLDGKEESDDDEEEMQFLDKMIKGQMASIADEKGSDPSKFDKDVMVLSLEKEKLALVNLIQKRIGMFHTLKSQISKAMEEGQKESMNMHYWCRSNQLRAIIEHNGDPIPDIEGKEGPMAFDEKLSSNGALVNKA